MWLPAISNGDLVAGKLKRIHAAMHPATLEKNSPTVKGTSTDQPEGVDPSLAAESGEDKEKK